MASGQSLRTLFALSKSGSNQNMPKSQFKMRMTIISMDLIRFSIRFPKRLEHMPYDMVSTMFQISVCFLLTYKGEMREKQTKKKKDWYPNTRPFGTKFARDAVIDSISDRIAQQVSDGVKIDVRREIKGTILNLLFDMILTLAIAVTKLKGVEQRAWMLLQAAGMYSLSN